MQCPRADRTGGQLQASAGPTAAAGWCTALCARLTPMLRRVTTIMLLWWDITSCPAVVILLGGYPSLTTVQTAVIVAKLYFVMPQLPNSLQDAISEVWLQVRLHLWHLLLLLLATDTALD